MNEFPYLMLALLEGISLGVFFFAGLWWTVRQLDSCRHVALLFLTSMLLRTSVVILGFYFILGDNWQHLLMGLLGFVIARIIIIRFTRSADQLKPLLRKASRES
ncbi:MAG: ATP synthase subunit I [Methylophaga sp.]|nr:ATP synthase subunit I [Methylophaga sp.]